jgi:hypothetical protein
MLYRSATRALLIDEPPADVIARAAAPLPRDLQERFVADVAAACNGHAPGPGELYRLIKIAQRRAILEGPGYPDLSAGRDNSRWR